jgi:trimeric autotransporter adhesin
MKNQPVGPLDFASIGAIFNDATTQLVGGVTTENKARVLSDLTSVQTDLANLLVQQPGQFTGETAIHAQNIVDQLNLEITAVNSLGTDPFAAKYINDVQRDLLDIVNGDANLTALANQHGVAGFAPVPQLLAHPAQFQGSQAQTAFMTQFVSDATDLGNQAVQLINSGVAANDPQVVALEQKIQSFASNADAFTQAQGGLYSARFNNEFAHDGVNGTATRALVDGLATGNAGEVQAAASVLAANAADVASNMLGFGQTPPPPNNGIPAVIDSFAVAGTVFNDATARLVGGVYDGNRAAITADLTATQKALQDLLTNDPADFQGRAAHDANTIIKLLGTEITAVQNAGTGVATNDQINHLQRAILHIVQHDSALTTLANAGGAGGFAPLPSAHGAGDQTAHNGKGGPGPDDHGAGVDMAAATPAAPPVVDHAHLWG